MNKKTFLLRVLLGFPLGVAINATIALLISWRNGVYMSVTPELAEAVGGQLHICFVDLLFEGFKHWGPPFRGW